MNIQWIVIGAAVIAASYFLYKILNYFGIIGSTDEAKGTKELYENKAMSGDPAFLPIAGKAYKVKYKKDITPSEVTRLTPSSSKQLLWSQNLTNARKFFDDDESLVYNVFRNFTSQFQLYFFSQFFQTFSKKSLIDYLDEFLDEDELYLINGIVKKLPII